MQLSQHETIEKLQEMNKDLMSHRSLEPEKANLDIFQEGEMDQIAAKQNCQQYKLIQELQRQIIILHDKVNHGERVPKTSYALESNTMKNINTEIDFLRKTVQEMQVQQAPYVPTVGIEESIDFRMLNNFKFDYQAHKTTLDDLVLQTLEQEEKNKQEYFNKSKQICQNKIETISQLQIQQEEKLMNSQKKNLTNLNYISQQNEQKEPILTQQTNPYKQQIEQIEKRESGRNNYLGFASKLNNIRNKYEEDEDEEFGLQTQKIQPVQITKNTWETTKKEQLTFPSFKTQEIEQKLNVQKKPQEDIKKDFSPQKITQQVPEKNEPLPTFQQPPDIKKQLQPIAAKNPINVKKEPLPLYKPDSAPIKNNPYLQAETKKEPLNIPEPQPQMRAKLPEPIQKLPLKKTINQEKKSSSGSEIYEDLEFDEQINNLGMKGMI